MKHWNEHKDESKYGDEEDGSEWHLCYSINQIKTKE
jgi:hypothetical protein